MSRRPGLLLLVVLVGACSEQAKIPCTEDATCAPYGALCVEGFCKVPEGGDPIDFSAVPDLAVSAPDLADPGCADNAACATATAPICDPSTRACRACATGECTAGSVCAPTGACVGCLVQADCDPSRKLCDTTTNTCVACKAHAECASKVCDAGLCAPETSVTHVDNRATGCAVADGSKLKPYCDVTSGVNAGKPYVLVEASPTSYGPLELVPVNASPLFIIGPGVGNPASLATFGDQTGNAPALAITAIDAQKYDVTLDGLAFASPAIASNPAAVTCNRSFSLSASIRLTIRRAKMTASSFAFTSFQCDVTIEDSEMSVTPAATAAASVTEGTAALRRNRFLGSKDAPLKLQKASYTVENNLFSSINLGGTGAAVKIDATAAGTFRFNTLWSSISGIDCAGAQVIAASIIAGNTEPVTGNCALVDTVTPLESPIGNPGAPDFVNPSQLDLRLKTATAANQACCTNKLTSGPAVDAENNPRPKGAKFDIGAYEVE